MIKLQLLLKFLCIEFLWPHTPYIISSQKFIYSYQAIYSKVSFQLIKLQYFRYLIYCHLTERPKLIQQEIKRYCNDKVNKWAYN